MSAVAANVTRRGRGAPRGIGARRTLHGMGFISAVAFALGCSSGASDELKGTADAGNSDGSPWASDSGTGGHDAGGTGGTGGTGGAGGIGGTGGIGGAGGTGMTGLASKYPCDQGIASDPAVVWAENFEEGSVDAVVARYSDHNGQSGMALTAGVPSQSCGSAAMAFTADPTSSTSNLYNKLSNYDELYARFYVKYQAGVQWHHAGLGLKGYNPPSPWPLGLAGIKPTGSDDFSVALEPVYGVGNANPRFDFYNYWMQMHSWMDQPSGSDAYFGNSLVHQKAFTADDDAWICLEMHVKMNTDLSSSTSAELDVWKSDALVQHFDSQTPLGCWIKDSFCPVGADGPECTDYASLCSKPLVPLDLQWRSTSALQLNAVGFGNYITSGPAGVVQFDDIVVATTRIGCE